MKKRILSAILVLLPGLFLQALTVPTKGDFDFPGKKVVTYSSLPQGQIVQSLQTGMGAITVHYQVEIGGVYQPFPGVPTDAGTYQVSVSTTQGVNYSEVSDLPLGTLKINPYEIIVTPKGGQSKEYDGSGIASISFDYTTTITREFPVFRGRLTPNGINVGEYTIEQGNLILEDGPAFKASNYTIKFDNTQKYNIVKRPLTVSLKNLSRLYDGTNRNEVMVDSYSNNVSGETPASQGAFVLSEVDAGTYDLTTSHSFELIDNPPFMKDNYELKFAQELKYTINKVPLTATYQSEQVEDGATPVLAITVEGFVNGESASTAKEFVAPKITNVPKAAGAYTLLGTGGSAKNYTFTYKKGLLILNSKYGTIAHTGSFETGETSTLTATVALGGYSFKQWSSTSSTQLSTNMTYTFVAGGSIAVLAEFQPITYTITYVMNGGDNLLNPIQTYKTGDQFALPIPTRAGLFSFDGWYNNPALTGDEISQISPIMYGNLILYAKWNRRLEGVKIVRLFDSMLGVSNEENNPFINEHTVYQWFKDGDEIVGENRQYIELGSPIPAALYRVKVSWPGDGGEPVWMKYLVVDETTLRIYPNPATPQDLIQIQSTRGDILSCTVLDARGNILWQNLSVNKESIKLPSLRSGVYLVQARTTHGKMIHGKLIIK